MFKSAAVSAVTVAVAEVEVEVDELVAKGPCFEVGDAVGVEESAREDEGDGVVEGAKERAGDGSGVAEGKREGERDGVSEVVSCMFNGCSSI